MTNTEVYTGARFTFDTNPAGTGWEIHPHAPWIIGLLAIIYLGSFWQKAFWRRWGFLISTVLIFVCLSYGELDTEGFKLGLVAFGIAVWAVIQNRRERKRLQAGAPQAGMGAP